MKSNVQLLYVLVDGVLRNVSDYDGMPPGERPPASCPVCRGPVVMRLGLRRAHHAAHKPSAICPVINPETAEHLNAKLHICSELSRGHLLTASCPCPGVGALDSPEPCICSDTLETEWASNWDEARMEYSLGDIRPDIAILRQEQIVGAIEILVRHEVAPDKAEIYRRLGIPWIEVDASSVLQGGAPQWTIESPLPVVNMGPEPRWRCDNCNSSWMIHLMEESDSTVMFSRVVDIYHQSGKLYRAVFQIRQGLDQGRTVIHWLHALPKPAMLCGLPEPAGPQEDIILRLRTVFRDHLKSLVDSFGARVDSPMEWQSGELTFEHAQSQRVFPRRYVWNDKTRQWVKNAQLAATKWPRG